MMSCKQGADTAHNRAGPPRKPRPEHLGIRFSLISTVGAPYGSRAYEARSRCCKGFSNTF